MNNIAESVHVLVLSVHLIFAGLIDSVAAFQGAVSLPSPYPVQGLFCAPAFLWLEGYNDRHTDFT